MLVFATLAHVFRNAELHKVEDHHAHDLLVDERSIHVQLHVLVEKVS